MESSSLDLLRAVKKCALEVGCVCVCVCVSIVGGCRIRSEGDLRRQFFFFEFLIWSWGMQWKILLEVISKCCFQRFELYWEDWNQINWLLIIGIMCILEYVFWTCFGEWVEFRLLPPLPSFWSLFMGCIYVCLEKRSGDSGVKQVLSGCLVEVKRWKCRDGGVGPCWWTGVAG